jgi:hypothetical protein
MTAAARCVLALSAALALALPAGASGTATQTNFRWSTPVPIIGLQATPHTGFFLIEPFETSVPHVGKATVQTFFVTCLPCDTASLSVRMTTKSGTLVLGGSSASDSETSNSGTWSVSDASTGRFARYAGSGTWTWSGTWTPEGGWDITLSLVGHLGRA